ncbi:MAG: hypothetical protein CMF22_12110 [Idiomarinaceae bacterium]|nr:hypothetical protein [Idiomarinaceae bacterium]|tara:strand:+ start:2910 stop:3509 length:600 start_codon:yes stop_codon:yes gene_type:complete
MKNETTMRFPFAGFGNTIHEAYVDDEFEMMLENDGIDGDDAPYDMQINDTNFLEFAKAYTGQLIHEINNSSELRLEARLTGIHPAKDYFTSNDEIMGVMPLEHLKTVRAHLLHHHFEEFKQKILDNCTSCSGFVSFVSNDINDPEWSENIDEWRADQTHLMLECLCECVLGEEWENGIAGDLKGNGHYDGFIVDIEAEA